MALERIAEEIRKRKDKLHQATEGRPYAMQTVEMEILYDIASLLNSSLEEQKQMRQELNRIAEEQNPQGIQVERSVDVEENENYESFDAPLFSIELINEGNSTIYYAINDPTREHVSLVRKERRSLNFGRAKVERLYYRCAKGDTSTLKMVGVF